MDKVEPASRISQDLDRALRTQLTKITDALERVEPETPEWMRLRSQERKLRLMLQLQTFGHGGI